MIKPRYKRFLEELPLNKNKILPSAIKAGYSPQYANSNGKTLYKNAIKQTAKDILEQASNKEITTEQTKELMCEIMGIDKGLLLFTLKKIAINDKDYGSAIKILSPLAKEAIGLDISQQEQQNITVPVLNIVVDKPDVASNKDIIDIQQ